MKANVTLTLVDGPLAGLGGGDGVGEAGVLDVGTILAECATTGRATVKATSAET